MKRRAFLLVFVTASVAEIVSLILGWEMGHMFAKPLIVPALIAYYFLSTNHRSMIFVLALLFCWAGDVFLLFQQEVALFFIFGLLAFLSGHVLYILSYRQQQSKKGGTELMWTQKVRYSLPILLAGTGLVTILYPDLSNLRLPVIVYSIVLMLMVMTALFRYGRTAPESFWMVFGGAAIFMISDSLLAINKFYAPFSFSGPVIMVTYVGAQFLIVEGVIRHEIKD